MVQEMDAVEDIEYDLVEDAEEDFILKILINNYFKSQKRSFLVVKISLKSRRLHFRSP